MAKIIWDAKLVQVSDLKPYEKNPRKISDHEFEKLKRSLQEDGYHQRIIANQDLTIVGGHQRLKALKDLGITEIEVLIPDQQLDDDTFRRINLRDNLPFGEFDNTKLLEFASFDELMDWGMPQNWIPRQDHDQNTPAGDPNDAPSIKRSATTVRGDVYQIGQHRLVCGDSTSADDMDLLMGNLRADQLLTDPPYNVAYEGKTSEALTIQNDEMGDTDFRQFLTDAFTLAAAQLKPGGTFYIWHADSEGYNFRGACNDAGLQIRQCLIWEKNSMVMGRQDYHWQHEPCLYGWKDGAAHLWAADRKQTTLMKFDRPTKSKEHPTMKPVDLIEYQIKNNTKGEDIILDVFGGSGTTMVAAHKIGRICHMMELDERYCDVIVERMHKLFPDLEIRRNDEVMY